MSKELGLLLKQLRTHCEITQQQVANVLHLDRSTYAYYESGVTEPDLKSISRLAKLFNVPVEDLLPKRDGEYKSLRDVATKGKTDIFTTENTIDLNDEKIYSLSKEERGFVAWLRVLSPEQKEKLKSVFEEIDG